MSLCQLKLKRKYNPNRHLLLVLFLLKNGFFGKFRGVHNFKSS
jgi:hypothetical protein